MKGRALRLGLIPYCAFLLVAGCDVPVAGPSRDNPNDPDSPVWTTQRPFIYDVSKTPDNKVQVKWLTQTTYGIYFKIDRRIASTGSYSQVGSVPGSAPVNVFIDSTNIPVGHTYAYRVGVVGSAGAITYSYDYPIDIF